MTWTFYGWSCGSLTCECQRLSQLPHLQLRSPPVSHLISPFPSSQNNKREMTKCTICHRLSYFCPCSISAGLHGKMPFESSLDRAFMLCWPPAGCVEVISQCAEAILLLLCWMSFSDWNAKNFSFATYYTFTWTTVHSATLSGSVFLFEFILNLGLCSVWCQFCFLCLSCLWLSD